MIPILDDSENNRCIGIINLIGDIDELMTEYNKLYPKSTFYTCNINSINDVPIAIKKFQELIDIDLILLLYNNTSYKELLENKLFTYNLNSTHNIVPILNNKRDLKNIVAYITNIVTLHVKH